MPRPSPTIMISNQLLFREMKKKKFQKFTFANQIEYRTHFQLVIHRTERRNEKNRKKLKSGWRTGTELR